MYSKEVTDRLKEAVKYLKHNGFPTQKLIAKEVGYDPSNLSQALNGSTSYLTSNFIENFCSKFNFDSLWILEGKNKMLKEGTGVKEPIKPFTFDDSIFDNPSRVSDLFRLLIRNHEKIKTNAIFPLYKKFIFEDGSVDELNKDSRNSLLGNEG